MLYVIARRALPDVAISHINLTKEIPTLISFARNDGWNYDTKIYISKKNVSHNKKKAAEWLYSKYFRLSKQGRNSPRSMR